MGIHDQEVKRIIKEQETYVYRRKFPRELKAYLYDTYGEDPWLYEFSMCDLYSGIKVDAREYFMGKLDVTRKPSHQKTPEGIEYFRKLYSNAICENRDLQNYISELHELLRTHDLKGNRMLCDEFVGHKRSLPRINSPDMGMLE